VLVVVGIILIIQLTNQQTGEPEVALPEIATGGRGTVAMPDNIDQLVEDHNRPVEDGYYITVMNVRWDFENGNSPSKNAYVENATDNTRTVFFEVFLKDDGRLVYSSPYIPVGASLRNFALDTVLPTGEHPATVTYFLVDDDGNVLSDVSVTVTLRILN
jgi:hypothetical protein